MPDESPASESTATVVVFEKRPRWGPELQRQFVDRDVRVRACRSTADALDALDGALRNVLIVELEAATADCLQLLEQLNGGIPFVPVIVIGSGRTAGLEWSTRELGALEFVPGFISGSDLARLCRRQWSNAIEADR